MDGLFSSALVIDMLTEFCMPLRLLSFVGLVILCTSSGLLAESKKDLLEEVLSNHRTARESIHTFYCRVSVTSNPEKRGLLPQGEYWRSPDAIRIRSQRGNITEDVLVQNSRLAGIVKEKTPRGENVHASISSQLNQPLGQCDVWAMGLLTFFGPQGGWVVLDELLNGQHKLNAVKRQTEGDRELVYIDLEHKNSRLEMWLDPQVNYLVRKLRTTDRIVPKSRGESEVIRFKEVASGIYFPEQVESRSYYDNQFSGITTKTFFTDIRINQSIQPDVFKLHYPPGVKVMDTIQGKFYTVDSEGRPTGEVKNMQVVQTPPLPVGADAPTVTESEPKSATRWILPVSLGVLAVGVIGWYIRRRAEKQPFQKPA